MNDIDAAVVPICMICDTNEQMRCFLLKHEEARDELRVTSQGPDRKGLWHSHVAMCRQKFGPVR